MLQYHDYESESDAVTTGSTVDFGSQASIQVTKAFGPRWTVGAKYTDYQQAGNPKDVAASEKKDVDKI